MLDALAETPKRVGDDDGHVVRLRHRERFSFTKSRIYGMMVFSLAERTPMTPSSPRRSASALSPAARALRLQRIYARMQDGAAYAEIAAEEGVSRERLRQIIRAATTRGRHDDRPDHSRMQIARLTPALRLAAAGVAEGDAKAIPLMLQIMDRLDRYSDPDEYFSSPPPQAFMTWRPQKSSKGGNGTAGRDRGALGTAPVEPPVPEREFDGNVEASPNDGPEGAPCPLRGGQALENVQNDNG
jgi:hypothetical protein